jgi:hypothetical protein
MATGHGHRLQLHCLSEVFVFHWRGVGVVRSVVVLETLTPQFLSWSAGVVST